MGHDSISFAGQHEVFRDWDLWVLRHFFVLAAKRSAEREPILGYVEAAAFFEGWDWLCPGVVTGTDFDVFVGAPSDPARIKLLFRILRQAKKDLLAFGETMPLSYITTHLVPAGCQALKPWATQRYRDEIDRMLALLGRASSQFHSHALPPHRPEKNPP